MYCVYQTCSILTYIYAYNEYHKESPLEILKKKTLKDPIVLFQRSNTCPINKVTVMSDREPTRWQHNRIYPYPINPCVYTYDLICHLQISI